MRERSIKSKETYDRWLQYYLPKDMTGKTFLDVGCWGGQFCVEAMLRGASQSVGVDLVRSPHWDKINDEEPEKGITFMQMDIFSPHFLTLPRFDVVLCAGVFYHTPNPFELLTRLKAVTSDNGKLFLETAIASLTDFCFCSEDSFDNNYSNWFLYSSRIISDLLGEVGFIFKQYLLVGKGRGLFVADVQQMVLPQKYLPRKKEYMK